MKLVDYVRYLAKTVNKQTNHVKRMKHDENSINHERFFLGGAMWSQCLQIHMLDMHCFIEMSARQHSEGDGAQNQKIWQVLWKLLGKQ